jgi:hypothetical protein
MTRVHLFLNRVDDPVEEGQRQSEIGMLADDPRDDRHQDLPPPSGRGVDPQAPGNLAIAAGQEGFRRADLLQRPSCHREISLAILRQDQAARASVDELHPEPRLQPADALADRGLGHAERKAASVKLMHRAVSTKAWMEARSGRAIISSRSTLIRTEASLKLCMTH